MVTETLTPAAHLRMATFRLARRLRAHRSIANMSDAQFAVLGSLFTGGSATLSELADRDRVSAPSMNRTVNGLEESGWVERQPDDTDRRKVNIVLTDAGRAVVNDTVRRRDEWLDDALHDLTDAEQDILQQAATIMRKVADR